MRWNSNPRRLPFHTFMYTKLTWATNKNFNDGVPIRRHVLADDIRKDKTKVLGSNWIE